MHFLDAKQPVGVREVALKYMRGVHASKIALFGRSDCLEFWSNLEIAGPKVEAFACRRCDFFVSHCWTAPSEWEDHSKPGDDIGRTYEYMKALQLNNTLQLVR